MRTVILILIIVSVFAIQAETDLFDFSKVKIDVSRENILYNLKQKAKIDCYNSDGQSENAYFRNGYICNNKLFLYSAYEKIVLSFDLSKLDKNMTPIDEYFLTSGKGPGEISFIMDMQLQKNKIYVSDGNNNRINLYNKEFKSIETIKTEFRPSKLSFFGSDIAINTYDGMTGNQMGYIYNCTDKSFETLFVIKETHSNNLSDMLSKNLITEFDDKGNIYLVRKYPDFTIHKFSSKTYEKSFVSKTLAKTKLPVPEFKVFQNDRKIWGLFAYKDIEYIKELNMLVTMSLTGWEELAEKSELTNILTGYDDSGNVILQYEFQDYIPDETCSIIYDSTSNRLLVISGSIYVFEIEKL